MTPMTLLIFQNFDKNFISNPGKIPIKLRGEIPVQILFWPGPGFDFDQKSINSCYGRVLWSRSIPEL